MNDNYDISEDALERTEDTQSNKKTDEKPDTGALPKDGKTEIVGIRFKKNGKTYYFAPNGFVLNQDDRVIVDTARGQEYGFTAVTNRELKNSEISEPLRSVIRMATAEDTRIYEENVKKEIDAFNACIVLIDKHRLEMKLIDAELSFDRSKLLFYFSAEGRVDFRELVKDLASTFHVRIEMRQIGIRDEAKILGGLGICGRPYCCNTFLTDFGQVSVKMAKEQNLSLNSAKISGSCGRLMCCLRYEYDTYLAEKALTPKVDSRVVTPNGAGVVVAANPLAGIVKVRLDSKGEDSEAIVFVREDVVDESKYDGQVLTKTALPDKKHKNDELPPVNESAFAPIKENSVPTTVQPSAEPSAEKNPEQSSDAPEKQNKHRHKHKKRHKGGQREQKNSEDHSENQSNDKGGDRHANGGVPSNHEQRPKNDNGQQQKKTIASQDGAGGSDNAQQKKNKKWKKPYYRHGKGKNRDNGENK
ncbi:MAG: stage 0 sporulation family protein [Clostridia bacterium]|nr:stage 0 sporulation family protein [Clostridia bacterium]